MGLTSDQAIDLKNELVDTLALAFPDKEMLELMVKRSLKKTLNQITQSEQGFETTVDKVVDWAGANGVLCQLVVGASLRNPGNSALQKFVENNLSDLLLLDPKILLPEDLLVSLVQALKAIVRIDDFSNVVFAACRQTFPDIEAGVPKLRERIHNVALGDSCKLLILLTLFLKTWERDENEHLSIVSFVQNFAELVAGAAQAELTRWLGSLPLSLQVRREMPESIVGEVRPSEEALKMLQASFIVMVEPFETSDKYGVNGYVVTRLGEEDRSPKFESVTLPIPTIEDAEAPAQANPAYTLESIQRALPEWLGKASEIILARGMALKEIYDLDLPPASSITVEFWLPFEQLSAETENWKIYGKPARLKRLNRVLGGEYKVVVRSYDRFMDPGSLNTLNRTWQEIVALAQQNDLSSGDSQDRYCLENWTQDQSLKAQMTQSILGLSLTFPICKQQYDVSREDLFAWMFDNGVPLVLWSRADDLSEASRGEMADQMQAWLLAANLTQLELLFEEVYQARRKADGDSLALWCDEPKRMIELKKFRKGGRLQA